MKIGCYIKRGKQLWADYKAGKAAYSQHRGIVKDWGKRLNERSCTRIEICKT